MIRPILRLAAELAVSAVADLRRNRLALELQLLDARIEAARIRAERVQLAAAADPGVDVDSFGPPAAVFESVFASADDHGHTIDLCRMRFPDGTVAPYIRVRESHTSPPLERWFAVSTLVHLAMNVGSQEVWQIGNREIGGVP